MSCTVTVEEIKTHFDRAFDFGDDDVRDSDIEIAITEADATFNEDLYPTDDICKLARKYLIAHYLLTDIEAAEGGGQTRFHQQSRSVGGVSESLAIPEWMQQGELAFYTTSYWGQKYLALSKPYMDGVVLSVKGGTNP